MQYTLHLSLPGEKLYHIRLEIGQITQSSHIANSKITGLNIRKLKLHATAHASSAPCSLTLLVSPRDLQRILSSSNQNYNSLLSLSRPCSSGETGLVTGETDPLEWQGAVAPTGDSDHQVRCISPGLGSSVQQHQDWGSLEPVRVGDAHKLPGIVGSNSGSQIIYAHLYSRQQTAVAYINNMGGTVTPS